MATYCVGDLAFMVDGTNSQGEQFRNHLYRLIFLLRRRFLFLSRRLNEWWDFPVFFSANNYWIIIGGGVSILSWKKATSNSLLEIPNERDRQTERQRGHTSVCLSLCLSVFLSVCLSFTGMRWVWWKATTKTREREREKERIPLNEFVEEFPYFWKVAPVFVEPKKTKKSSSLGKDILIIFWRSGGKKISQNNNNTDQRVFVFSLSSLFLLY